MSTTKYKASWSYMPKIEPLAVESESASFVTTANGRQAKHSMYSGIYDTWQDAHQALLAHYESSLDSARRRLQRAQSEFGNAKGMKPPKDSPPSDTTSPSEKKEVV